MSVHTTLPVTPRGAINKENWPPNSPGAPQQSAGHSFETPPPQRNQDGLTPSPPSSRQRPGTPTTQGFRKPALVLQQKDMPEDLKNILNKTNLTEPQKEIINALRDNPEIIITGSAAIAILQAYYLNSEDNFKSELTPNDVDILKGDYEGKNSGPITPLDGTAKIKGKTEEINISVEHCRETTTSNDALFINIYGLKVHCSEQLLEKYTHHKDHKKETGETKLNILKDINKSMRKAVLHSHHAYLSQ